ncbi:hypothetical protein BRADI_1g01686v3 [Brachypodium distachyon]|uniref:Uncharacterized protein n=1 Tax=Brachypodium distachyon TaxID=15368 RepID=A0A0Q3GM08_BRADI|nr:hypothetical protein BRADI_1g01686v3 [Brachypodium distachyon]PNT73791.1 hypothetical protein BRADI_1g01686v3 [Brachypodium distachyon]
MGGKGEGPSGDVLTARIINPKSTGYNQFDVREIPSGGGARREERQRSGRFASRPATTQKTKAGARCDRRSRRLRSRASPSPPAILPPPQRAKSSLCRPKLPRAPNRRASMAPSLNRRIPTLELLLASHQGGDGSAVQMGACAGASVRPASGASDCLASASSCPAVGGPGTSIWTPPRPQPSVEASRHDGWPG